MSYWARRPSARASAILPESSVGRQDHSTALGMTRPWPRASGRLSRPGRHPNANRLIPTQDLGGRSPAGGWKARIHRAQPGCHAKPLPMDPGPVPGFRPGGAPPQLRLPGRIRVGRQEVRQRALRACETLVAHCGARLLCGGPTEGMRRECEIALAQGLPVLAAPAWDGPRTINGPCLEPVVLGETFRPTAACSA